VSGLLVAAAFLGLGVIYLSHLDACGLSGPDEPRYAAIGAEMARGGDWVTPRLWGSPWFEKPPLTYWLTAAGRRCGLGKEWAPRLPVALLSLLFLIFFYRILRRLEGREVAALATLLAGTSAGWVAFSQVGVTDLPLAATFCGALWLGLLWLETSRRDALAAAGVLFGLSLLAKGLVAGVLILPFLWFARARWREFRLPALAAALVAGPWYTAVTWLHGRAFVDEFILKHHLSRFASDELLHGRPFWFYAPVLLAGLFPWTPLLAMVGRESWATARHRTVAVTFAFGFVFFSLSANKLPGYLLPLIPALCVMVALGIVKGERSGRPLACCVFLLGMAPGIAALLPEAMVVGLSRAEWDRAHFGWLAVALVPAAAVWLLESRGRRGLAYGLAGLLAAGSLAYIKWQALPALDQVATGRSLWLKVRPHAGRTCVEKLQRNWSYGLYYYAGGPLPVCSESPMPVAIQQQEGGLPQVSVREPSR
jgi:4-amino-4-deoxy-L-arabinose transferase-like glycosyltransferase